MMEARGYEKFLENYIFTTKSVAKIYLGHDFAFGANKSGDFHVAKKICDEKGAKLILQQEFKVENESVSSTAER